MTTTDHPADRAAFDFNPLVSPASRGPPPVLPIRARPPAADESRRSGAYMVTRYEDLRTVIDDPGNVLVGTWPCRRSTRTHPRSSRSCGGATFPETNAVVNEDEPEHTPIRRVFDAGFTGARVRAMLPTMHETADALIDAFPRRGADLVGDYAVPFVQTVISAIIGFPPEDTAQIQAWTDDQNTLWNLLAPVEQHLAAAERMGEYTPLPAGPDRRTPRAPARGPAVGPDPWRERLPRLARRLHAVHRPRRGPGRRVRHHPRRRSPRRCWPSCRTRRSAIGCWPTRSR